MEGSASTLRSDAKILQRARDGRVGAAAIKGRELADCSQDGGIQSNALEKENLKDVVSAFGVCGFDGDSDGAGDDVRHRGARCPEFKGRNFRVWSGELLRGVGAELVVSGIYSSEIDHQRSQDVKDVLIARNGGRNFRVWSGELLRGVGAGLVVSGIYSSEIDHQRSQDVKDVLIARNGGRGTASAKRSSDVQRGGRRYFERTAAVIDAESDVRRTKAKSATKTPNETCKALRRAIELGSWRVFSIWTKTNRRQNGAFGGHNAEFLSGWTYPETFECRGDSYWASCAQADPQIHCIVSGSKHVNSAQAPQTPLREAKAPVKSTFHHDASFTLPPAHLPPLRPPPKFDFAEF
ncbi:hypothetical protein DFH09DRAFT_1082758 [Mycena vulgaris]|nr:hypothetical protein DFH09DRAFT_1082758 [Mycena vulgaris]